MAGAINGLGAQQLATSLTPASESRDSNNRVRESDDSESNSEAIESGEAVQRSEETASSSQTQESDNPADQSEFERQLEQIQSAGTQNESQRGSIIDITV